MVKLCFSIGVSQAERLEPLPGAIIAANEVYSWAQRSGYVVTKVTDDVEPATIPRIKDALDAILSTHADEEIEHFVLHFAGHGYRNGAENHVWVPGGWYESMQVISVEGLKVQLYQYGIKNISIFSDSCRSSLEILQQDNIQPINVLGRGRRPVTPVKVDRYNASRDGKKAYMIQSDGIHPSRCIFSSVLFEGINGHQEAFDTTYPDHVSAHSLEHFIDNRMIAIADIYQLDLQPDIMVMSTPHSVVFHKREAENLNCLPQPQWPSPSEMSNQAVEQSGKRRKILNPQRTMDQIKTGGHMWKVIDSFYAHDYLSKPNLIVFSEKPVRIWASGSSCSTSNVGACGLFNVLMYKDRSSQILVEFSDGSVTSAVIYKGLITVVKQERKGSTSWYCLEHMQDEFSWNDLTARNIKALQRGDINAREVDHLTAQLRADKHVNPILGAISSYLYDYTGDIDSIRRMAYFYCEHRQPIPFDIALMGHLTLKTKSYKNKNKNIVKVPAVCPREFRGEKKQLPDWVSQATNESQGLVAGYWPWLRQGWQFIGEPTNGLSLYEPWLKEIVPHLLPSQFSSFNRAGAELLIDKFKLRSNLWG